MFELNGIFAAVYIFTIGSKVLLQIKIERYICSVREWSECFYIVCKAYIIYPRNSLVYLKKDQHWL